MLARKSLLLTSKSEMLTRKSLFQTRKSEMLASNLLFHPDVTPPRKTLLRCQNMIGEVYANAWEAYRSRRLDSHAVVFRARDTRLHPGRGNCLIRAMCLAITSPVCKNHISI